MLAGDYEFTFNPDTPSLKVLRATKRASSNASPGRALHQLGWRPGHDITQGRLARRHTVAGCLLGTGSRGQGRQDHPDTEQGEWRLLLLEPVKAAKPAPFSWDQASVYFLLTDRFTSGDPANDHSFGRQKDGQDEVATWHGGDFKGADREARLHQATRHQRHLDHPMVEQVHGFIGGGERGTSPSTPTTATGRSTSPR